MRSRAFTHYALAAGEGSRAVVGAREPREADWREAAGAAATEPAQSQLLAENPSTR